jgi:thioredoxin 1
MARQYTDVVFLKVDVDKVPSIKNILGVWAMPTFAFLRNGNKVGSFMGANEQSLRRGLENDGNMGVCSSCSIQ